MGGDEDRHPREDDDSSNRARARDRDTESTPTASGHSTADDEATRNQEDESPS